MIVATTIAIITLSILFLREIHKTNNIKSIIIDDLIDNNSKQVAQIQHIYTTLDVLKQEIKNINYLLDEDEEEEKELTTIEQLYKEYISNPRNIVGHMGFDEYMEWLELGTIEDAKKVRQILVEHEMYNFVKMTDAYIKKKS